MKKILFLCFALLALVGCKKEDELGPEIKVEPMFDLSKQTGASEWATEFIQDFYDRYGTYIIYDWEPKDPLWAVYYVSNSESAGAWHITKPDPANVENYLRFMKENWLDVYSEDKFYDKDVMPRRILLTDSLVREGTSAWANETFLSTESHVPWSMSSGAPGEAWLFPGVDSLTKMGSVEKANFGKLMTQSFRNRYTSEGLLIFFPNDFFNISGDLGYYETPLYVNPGDPSAVVPISAANSRLYRTQLYEKGFLPNFTASFSGNPMQEADPTATPPLSALNYWPLVSNFPTITISAYQQDGYTLPDGSFVPNGTVASTGSYAACLQSGGGDLGCYMRWIAGEMLTANGILSIPPAATWDQIKQFLKDYPLILEKWNYMVMYYRTQAGRPEVRADDPVTYPITIDQLQ